MKKAFPEKSFPLLRVTHKSGRAEGKLRVPKGTSTYLANILSSKSENGAPFLITGLSLTWSLSLGGTVVLPGTAGSPAASPSSLPEAAAVPPFGAPAPSPALEAGIERRAGPPSGTLSPGSALRSRAQWCVHCGARGQQEGAPQLIHPDMRDPGNGKAGLCCSRPGGAESISSPHLCTLGNVGLPPLQCP